MKLTQKACKLFRKIKNKLLLTSYLCTGKKEILNLPMDFSWLEGKWPISAANCYKDASNDIAETDSVDLAIIVPLYNSEKYIDSCIKQLLEQKTKYKYHIILVNDGSKDNTLTLAQKYQKKYIDKIVLINQKNQGISCARNAGIKASNSKYLSFIDHDDSITEDMIEKLMSTAYREDADIVKSAFANVVNGKIKSVQEKIDIVIKGEMQNQLFDFRSYVFPGVFRSDLFKHIQFPEGYWYEDMIIRTLIYRQSCTFVHISDVLYYKHFHDDNASFVIWKTDNYKCLEQLYLVMHMIEAGKKIGLPEDIWLYQCILREFAVLLPQRIRGVDVKTKQMAFLKACEIQQYIYKEEYFDQLAKENKVWHRIFSNKEYKLWLLMSGYY